MINDNYSTYNEPLGNGLKIETEIAEILSKHNYTDKSMRRYLNMRYHYFNLFEDKLLSEGYCLGEIWDIFNYCFKGWYYQNIGSKSKRKRDLVIEDFLNSPVFERFVMTQNTVSKIGKDESIKELGFWESVNLNAKSMNLETIY